MESYKEILKYCGADEELNLQDKSEYDTGECTTPGILYIIIAIV